MPIAKDGDTNPRFANYARVNGRTPEAQLEQDRKDWPGGIMTGYILWNTARLKEYGKLKPDAFLYGRLIDHTGYDAWLNEWSAS